jgi:RNA polymerase sigma-70 factor (ECF subfamily)
MFQIARNEVARAAKRLRNVRQGLPLEESALACAVHPRHEYVEFLAAALDKLDAADRELVELKIFAGLTFREIADVVDLPQGTVATRYRRGLESLREWSAKQFR